MRVSGRARSGYWSIAMGLAALSVAAAALGAWATASAQNTRDLARRRTGLDACEVARSAVDLAFWHAQRQLVTPASDLTRWLRDSGARPWRLEQGALAPLSRLPGGDRFRVRVLLSVSGRRELSLWGDASGLLTATVAVEGPDGLVRRASEARAFRLQRVALPPPLDGWAAAPRGTRELWVSASSDRVVADPVAELSSTPAGRATAAALASPANWTERAAWTILARRPDALARWVGRRLAGPRGRVDGVVFVDNADGPIQSLRDVVFRGRALVVVTGRVMLEDVRLADPARDRLTVVTYDAVALAGVVAAAVVRLAPEDGTPDPSPSSGRAQVRGALLDLTGATELPFAGTLLAPSAGQAGSADLDWIVLVSPIRRPGPITRG